MTRFQRLRKFLETVRDRGELSDSPTERLESLALDMIRSQTLPNVVLGGLAGAVVSRLTGAVGNLHVAAFIVFYLLSLAVYVFGQEVYQAYVVAKEEYETDWLDDRNYQ